MRTPVAHTADHSVSQCTVPDPTTSSRDKLIRTSVDLKLILYES